MAPRPWPRAAEVLHHCRPAPRPSHQPRRGQGRGPERGAGAARAPPARATSSSAEDGPALPAGAAAGAGAGGALRGEARLLQENQRLRLELDALNRTASYVGNRVARVLVGARRANNYNAALVGELKRWNRKLEGENQRLFTARALGLYRARGGGRHVPSYRAGPAYMAAAMLPLHRAGAAYRAACGDMRAGSHAVCGLQPVACAARRLPLHCDARDAALVSAVVVLFSRGGALGRSALCRAPGTGCRHIFTMPDPACARGTEEASGAGPRRRWWSSLTQT